MTTGLGNHLEQEDFAVIFETALKNSGKPFSVGPMKTVQAGISTCLRALLDPELASDSGSYLEDCNVKDVYDYAKGEENEDRLWSLSEQLTGDLFDV